MPEESGWSLVSLKDSESSFLAKFSGNFGADNLVGRVSDTYGCYGYRYWRWQQSGFGFTTHPTYNANCGDETKTRYLQMKEKSPGSTTKSYFIDVGSDLSSNPQAETWKVLIRRRIQIMDY